MANYLVSRRNLAAVVMLCDPRHGLKELDEALLEVIRPRVEDGLQFRILLTKAVKLTRSEQAKALQIARLQAGGGSVQMFSALKRQGVGEAALWLRQQVEATQQDMADDGGTADGGDDHPADDGAEDLPGED